MGWVDAVTGSRKRQTLWLWGIDSQPVIEPSALELWLIAREGAIQHDWRHTEGTWKTIWGRSTGWSHGRAPATYSLSYPGLIEIFVRESSDEELAAFVDTMRHGSRDEKDAAVSAASDRILATLKADHGHVH